MKLKDSFLVGAREACSVCGDFSRVTIDFDRLKKNRQKTPHQNQELSSEDLYFNLVEV